MNETAAVEIITSPAADDIIIDIRHPDDIEAKPLPVLPIVVTPVLDVPFYQLPSHIKQLDSNKRYLLYCELGIMSRIQAELMAEKGINNVHVLVIERIA